MKFSTNLIGLVGSANKQENVVNYAKRKKPSSM